MNAGFLVRLALRLHDINAGSAAIALDAPPGGIAGKARIFQQYIME